MSRHPSTCFKPFRNAVVEYSGSVICSTEPQARGPARAPPRRAGARPPDNRQTSNTQNRPTNQRSLRDGRKPPTEQSRVHDGDSFHSGMTPHTGDVERKEETARTRKPRK